MGFCIQKVQDKEINYEMWNAQNQKVAFLKSAFVAELQLSSIPLVGLGYSRGGENESYYKELWMWHLWHHMTKLLKAEIGAHPMQRTRY